MKRSLVSKGTRLPGPQTGLFSLGSEAPQSFVSEFQGVPTGFWGAQAWLDWGAWGTEAGLSTPLVYNNFTRWIEDSTRLVSPPEGRQEGIPPAFQGSIGVPLSGSRRCRGWVGCWWPWLWGWWCRVTLSVPTQGPW